MESFNSTSPNSVYLAPLRSAHITRLRLVTSDIRKRYRKYKRPGVGRDEQDEKILASKASMSLRPFLPYIV